MDNSAIVADKIRNGVLDVNVQELFFSILIKGLLYKLNTEIKIRGIDIPHMILHTGDDKMWIEAKGYNAGIEPLTISNEQAIYSIIPKCIVNTSSIDLDLNQLTSPYALGTLQYCTNEEDIEGIYSFTGEFRRMPIKLSVELKYYTESYTDMLELIQNVIANLSFIRTFDIMYLGQKIKCSYKLPESFGEEHTMELDGAMSDNKNHSLTLSLEVETSMPIFNNKTIMPSKIITKAVGNIYTNINETK